MMPRRRLIYSLLLLLLSCSLSAQKNERKDSLVRLLGCDVLQQVEDEHGENFRKAIGHARFEHNSTLLLCDTALWNVGANTIRAEGNVKIIQNRTVLTSDRLLYYIDDNLAEFRGSVVQLQDKDKNTLRTRHLDYNTKDSVATFSHGGAFRDKDGQIIESVEGSYDSKIKNFNFFLNVNMYTDSVFVKTKVLDYNTGTSVAVFGDDTHAWKDENMLSARAGWYDRANEVFTFMRDVHVMTATQEAWADTMVYKRVSGEAELMGHAELIDTDREVTAIAGYMQYIDSLQYIKMTRDPAVIAVSEQDGSRDTVYVGADTFIYWTLPRCDVPEVEFRKSDARIKDLNIDPVGEYRRKAAEEAKAAAEEARRKKEEEDPNAAGARNLGRQGGGPGKSLPAAWDDDPEPEIPLWTFVPQVPDSTAVPQRLDSLKITTDSLQLAASLQDSLATSQPEEPKDSTKIGFLLGIRNVRIFRKDMQARCDSLAYTDIDSLVRMYNNPLVWNEVRRQYSADSITVVIKDRSLERASLMSNAFIIVQEDSILFDQIKGAEMMAWFDSTGALQRFDALGGASGVFFIEEKGTLATVNKFESKMLTASFRNGDLYDLNYFEDVKSDAYPVVQLKRDERVLKGFEWQPDKRPNGPEDITTRTPRKSERAKYEKVPRCQFAQTDEYFPGYIESVLQELKRQNELKEARKAERRRMKEEIPVADTLGQAADTLGQAAVAMESPGVKVARDTIVVGNTEDDNDGNIPEATAQADSVKAGKDLETLRSLVPKDPKEEERARIKAEKEAKKAEKEKLRAEKEARKQAKWAELDAKDAQKAARKAEKALVKQRAKTLKMLKAKQKQEAKEQKMLEKYKAKFEKQKARKEAKAAKKAGKTDSKK